MRLPILCCLLIFGFVSIAAQKERYVRPVDEAGQDASFLAFRTKLIAAAKRRDAKYVLGVLDKNIKNGFGGNDGIAEFKKWWKIESPTSEFWKEFLPVITGGGKFSVEEGRPFFTAPALFTRFPEDLDAFEHQVIFGNNVNLRARPDMNSKPIALLSYNIVKVDYPNSVKKRGSDDDYEWLRIETLGGQKGFVKSEFVRSPIDYRAGFEKKNGRWKMTYFVSGD